MMLRCVPLARPWLIGAGAAVLLLLTSPAGGQSPPGAPPQLHPHQDRLACEAIYQAGLTLVQKGELQRAQREFVNCAKPKCGHFLEHQCTVEYAELQAETPSVVPVVNDSTGRPIDDVQVTMDGQPLTSRIDGRAIPIDPGVHEFSFEKDQQVLAARKLLVLQGERNRPIVVSVKPRDQETAKALEVAAAIVTDEKTVVAVPKPSAPPKEAAAASADLQTAGKE